MTLGRPSTRLDSSGRNHAVQNELSSSSAFKALTLVQRVADGYSESNDFLDEQGKYKYEYRNDLWYHGNQLVIPGPDLRREVVERAYDSPYSRHFGIAKTTELVRRFFW